MKKRQSGVTLVELMLVLVVSAMLIFFSIRQYQLFRVDSDIRQLQGNVDQFFDGMNRFYQYQCYGTTRADLATPTVAYGRLHPRITSTSPFIIDALVDLQTPGFIDPSNFPFSPLVGTTGPAGSPYTGYVLQFNRTTEPRLVCTAACNGSQPVTGVTAATNCCTTAQTGTTVSWSPQVAVLMKNSTAALAYLRLLGGDCLSSLQGSTVTPCTGAGPGSGNYVVWQRQPNYASSEAPMDSMQLSPGVTQFTNMYRTAPVTYLTGKSHTTEFQYYVCGG